MLANALLSLLLAAEPSSTGSSPAGFNRGGFGVELNASVATSDGSGTNSAYEWLIPQWEVGLRFRFGTFFSIGVSGELFDGITGGPGDEWSYQRRQIAVDVQWRFWGFKGLLRPWVAAGMAWGDIHSYHLEEPYPPIDAHVWEFLRLAVGLDVVPLSHLAIGPWFRYGFANTKGPYSADSSLRTAVFGLRVTVAFP